MELGGVLQVGDDERMEKEKVKFNFTVDDY